MLGHDVNKVEVLWALQMFGHTEHSSLLTLQGESACWPATLVPWRGLPSSTPPRPLPLASHPLKPHRDGRWVNKKRERKKKKENVSISFRVNVGASTKLNSTSIIHLLQTNFRHTTQQTQSQHRQHLAISSSKIVLLWTTRAQVITRMFATQFPSTIRV